MRQHVLLAEPGQEPHPEQLDASSRSEAVERAIEIGLLEPFPGLGLAGSANAR